MPYLSKGIVVEDWPIPHSGHVYVAPRHNEVSVAVLSAGCDAIVIAREQLVPKQTHRQDGEDHKESKGCVHTMTKIIGKYIYDI